MRKSTFCITSVIGISILLYVVYIVLVQYITPENKYNTECMSETSLKGNPPKTPTISASTVDTGWTWIIPPILPKSTPTTLLELSDIIQRKQPKIDRVIAQKIAYAVNRFAPKYKLPPKLIICVIEQESSFQPMRTSKANCKGLMQINEKFHKEKLKKLGIKGSQIYYIDNNIHLGCMILREYYNKTRSISGALQKYLGANNRTYICDILGAFSDLIIEQK